MSVLQPITQPTASHEKRPSRQSVRALDLLNFFKADAQTTSGPYLAIFLRASRHWNLGRIGFAMSIPTVVTLLAQTPAGAVVDSTRRKRALIAGCAIALALASILVVEARGGAGIFAAQLTAGLAMVFIPPAIAALSLGLVGRDRFALQMGRNEMVSHAGGVAAALMTGVIGYAAASAGIFYLAAAMAIAAAVASLTIREDEIDHEAARESDSAHDGAAIPVMRLLSDRRVVAFGISVILFHLANAAMLPLAGERLAAHDPHLAAPYMSACILLAQAVMLPVAAAAGYLADRIGRRPIFLIGFAVLPIRGLLFALGGSVTFQLSIQVLDGIGAGIFGVVSVIVAADLASGSGRFNLLQGAIGTCVAIGGSLSNPLGGVIAQRYGYRAAFIVLGAVASTALISFWATVPETRPPAENQDRHLEAGA